MTVYPITSSDSVPSSGERRRNARHRPSSIIYVQLGSGNGGIVVNLGIDGLSFQAAGKLPAEGNSTLNLRLRGDGLSGELSADIVWLGATQKEAGICFKGFSGNLQQDIAAWMARQMQDCEVAGMEAQSRLKPMPAMPGTPATGEISIPPSLVAVSTVSPAMPASPPPSTNPDANGSRLRFFLDSGAKVSGTTPGPEIVSPIRTYPVPPVDPGDPPQDRHANSVASPKQPPVEQPLGKQPQLELPSIQLPPIEHSSESILSMYRSLPIFLPEPAAPQARLELAPAPEEPRKKDELPKNEEVKQIPLEDRVLSTPAASREVTTTEKRILSTLLAAWRRGTRQQKLLLASAATGCLWILVVILTLTVTHTAGSRLILKHPHRYARVPLTVVGSVIKQNANTLKESPITDVEISAPAGLGIGNATSDFTGYFKINLPLGVDPGESIMLRFRHPDYRPVDLNATVGDHLYVVPMIPIHGEVEAELSEAETVMANVLIRYTTEITITENIGVGVKTFQVVNTGNIPCYQHLPCSPDGKWTAAIDSASLDAGDGNVFQNARVSCIAGPCPFTKIDSDDFPRNARTIKVSVRNWSDTTTFLLQAEVFHTQVRDIVRKSYPVIFGRSLNFTVPGDAEGVTMEAETNGSQTVFPLAPNPALSWTDCKVKIEEDQARDYRCELKPGYRFR
jgi:hypothetical protein